MEKPQNRSSLIFGAILIGVGILLFVGQVFDVMNWGEFWPFIVIGAGLAFFVGMFLTGKSAGGLAVPGSIITTIGLILLVQTMFGWWEAWSYAWGLIVASVGVGIAIHGMWSDNPERQRRGWEVTRTGLVLFLVFGAIFEFIFSFTGVSGRPGSLFWALLVAALGLFQLVVRSYRLITNPAEVKGDGRDLGGPILLAGVGIFAALAVQDILPASKVWSLLSLWPLLLVGAGVQIIFGRRTPWVGALVAVAILAVAFTIAFAGERLGIRLSSPWRFGPITFSQEPWKIRQRVTGNGQMGENSPEVSDFNRVKLSSVGILKIVQGESESLTITAEENLLEYITTRVSGNELEIGVEPGIGITPTQDITYLLTVKNLEEVSLSGAGEVIIDELATDRLVLESSGVSKFTLGDLQAERLEVHISGTGSAEVAGKVEMLEISISGAGNFNGADLQAQEAEVKISGLGNTTVWVERRLDTSISGAGNISYYGDPQVSKTTSGAGSVNHKGSK